MATQRHSSIQSEISEQGFGSSNKAHVETFVEMKVNHEISLKKRSYSEVAGWLFAAAFVLWYGNGKRNFVYVVLHDPKLRQHEFFVGCLCIIVNTCIFFYLAVWIRTIKGDNRVFNVSAPGAIPTAVILGLSSYAIFIYAMWPIWGWIIVPMLYFLFMGFVVLAPFIPPYANKQD